MNPIAVFVLSDVRSGSTLLDLCLGAHPRIVSLGEVHWLAAYATEDRSLYDPDHPLVCSCGLRLADCPFWASVAARLGKPLESLQVRSAMRPPRNVRRSEQGLKRILRRSLNSLPVLLRSASWRSRFGSRALASDLLALFDAACSVAGCNFCIDSSKSTLRFRDYRDFVPDQARAIVIARDYRAVVHSRMKRGQSLRAAALGWRRKMLEIESMTHDLDPAVVHRLTYEQFCENPGQELRRICEFLGVEFSERMLARPTAEVHHIGGSPSKFDASLTGIVRDRSHENRFTPAELSQMSRLVGRVAAKWGY